MKDHLVVVFGMMAFFGLNNIYSQKKHICKYNTNGTGSDGKRSAYI